MMGEELAPDMLIVPGAWHREMHVQPLMGSLRSRGYSTRCIELATVQIDKPRPTWDEEVSNISNAVLSYLEAGKNVCLMLHSYAGLPGCEALNRVIQAKRNGNWRSKGRLQCVVFLASHHFPVGFVVDTKQFIGPANPSFSIDDATSMAIHRTPYEEFFNEMSRENASPYVDAIKPMHYIPGGGVLTSDDWKKVPRMLIGTSRDVALKPELQKTMWKVLEHEIRWIDADHSPFVSNPELIAALLIEAATCG